jgi:plasmid maintenance system antidote protein VapI
MRCGEFLGQKQSLSSNGAGGRRRAMELHMSFLKKRGEHMNEELGRRLRTLRMLMGKSRTDLAEALGVSPARIEDFECGSAAIGAQLLRQLSDELNVPPSFFLEARVAPAVPETARPL